MKTKLLLSIFFSLVILSVNAQIASDALKYSQTFNGGTARFVSMGGAFGALGGDFSSLSYNPAGLGVFRSSEFTITPSFKSRTISSDYNGTNNTDTRNRMNFDNLGFVFSFKPSNDAETGLVNLNFAFGYNRTNDYFTNSIASGNNSVNSMIDYFAGKANGNKSTDLTDPNDGKYNPFLDSSAPWEAIMAWNTFLINPSASGNNNYEAALNPGDGVNQNNTISNTGSTGEYVLSLGANFSQKFFLGATVGFTSLDYVSSITYSEKAFPTNDTIWNGDKFISSSYRQSYETSGSGYNFKIGALYKPIEGLRLGLAIHTPTYYDLQDTYSYRMESDFKFGTSHSNTPNSRYDYHLETPFKTIASIAYTFKDLGLLSIDLEHVNYSSMRFRNGGDGYDYSTENSDINNQFRNVNNIRVGGEVRVNDVFFRGGYAYYPSPYKKGFLNDAANRSLISGGIGYRSGNFIIDAAYLYSIQKEKYIFYDLPDVNPVSTKMTEGKFLVTLGFKF